MIGSVGDRRSFVELRRHGVRVRRGALGASHLAGGGDVRVAYAIGTRTGNAVVRNRLRRRIRAILVEMAEHRPDLLPPGALLISAGPDVVRRTPEELRTDVSELLEALRCRRASSVTL